MAADVVAYDLVDMVTVHYRATDGDWAMVEAEDGGDGSWTGLVPGFPVDTVVEWYLTSAGENGGTSMKPVEGARAPYTYTVRSLADGVAKLLITELNTGKNINPYEGMFQIAPEFIEIHNPNDFDVDMSDYYLTDAISYVVGAQLYWNITTGTADQTTIGGGHYNDFTARFPDGYTMAPGQTIVVSMASSGWFEGVYGRLPDLEMYEDERSIEGIPAMRSVFPDTTQNSIFTPGRDPGSDDMPRGIPEMEEYWGEPLILYHWEEGAPTVTDVDIFIWGASKTGQYAYSFDKSEVDGYLDDTPIADQDWFEDIDETGNVSYTRLDAEEGTQLTFGSNGVLGRDETSENWTMTFDKVYPTPGVFFASLEASETVALTVPPRTFLPTMGETFDIEIVSFPNSETKLRIIDLEGRLVIELWDSRFDGDVSGFPDFPTTVQWDGRDATFEQVRAGMYVVHLQAVNRVTGEKTVKTAPVVIATRLK